MCVYLFVKKSLKKLIKTYFSYSDWNGLNFKPIQSYTKNISSLSNPALKLFNDWLIWHLLEVYSRPDNNSI